MNKLVVIWISKLVIVFQLELFVQELGVLSLFLPMLMRTEVLDVWIHPWLRCEETVVVLVLSKAHLKVQLVLIWQTEVFSSWNQVMNLSSITLDVEVNVAEHVVALSWIASLHYFVEQVSIRTTLFAWWVVCGWLRESSIVAASSWFDVGISSETSDLISLLNLLLHIFTIL